MKKLLATLLLSASFSVITMGASAQTSAPDAPTPASIRPDTFKVTVQNYPQAVSILRHATNDYIYFTNMCTSNNNSNSNSNSNCSFQLSGSSGNIAVVIGRDGTDDHCIFSIKYNTSGADSFTMAPACGGNLTASSALNHTGHYQYEIVLQGKN